MEIEVPLNLGAKLDLTGGMGLIVFLGILFWLVSVEFLSEVGSFTRVHIRGLEMLFFR